jgi:hypothetical protein
LAGEIEVLGEKTCSAPLCPPQILEIIFRPTYVYRLHVIVILRTVNRVQQWTEVDVVDEDALHARDIWYQTG